MNLPDELKKYENYVNTLSLIDTSQYQLLSDRIIKQILKSKDGKLILKVKNGYDAPKCYIPEFDEIPNCFADSVWSLTTIEDKIKIIDKYMDYLFQNDPKSKPKLRIIPRPQDPVDKIALANYNHSSHSLFLNLDKLRDLDGINYMSLIFHECVHARDMGNIESTLLPDILRKYTDLTEEQIKYPKVFEREIIELNTTGYLFNRLTGKKEVINNSLKDDILKCKNFMEIFNDVSIENPKAIKSKVDFEKYINSMLYYYSPVERFARVGVRNFFRTQLNAGNIVSSKDMMTTNSIVDSELAVEKMLDELREMLIKRTMDGSQETIIDMKNLLDLAIKYKFYTKKSIYGKSNREKFESDANDVINKYNNVIDAIYTNYIYQKYQQKENIVTAWKNSG